MRKPIIAGNWKLNKTARESIILVDELKRALVDMVGVDVVVCPPFVNLSVVVEELIDHDIAVGAQNVYWQDSGAFTGEVSCPMLVDLDVKYVILGHSERRQYFGETNETVNKRLQAVLKTAMTPIVCVGENLKEREANQAFAVIENHCAGSFAGISADDMRRVVIAYEPVWAIGTGKTATPEQAQEIHAFIRSWLGKNFGPEVAESVRIQYGGSVTPENSAALMAKADIDGALVGGASLKAPSFAAIVKAAAMQLK